MLQGKAKKEYQKNYMKARRSNKKENVRPNDVRPETVPPGYVYGTTGKYLNLPERLRYLTLSDGQVLDRANQPSPNDVIPAMNMCNESYFNYRPTKKK